MLGTLEKRLGRLHARQRLGIEKDHEAQVFGQGLNFFHLENATLSHSLIRGALMLTGLYWRGLSNTAKVELKHNRIVARELPTPFDGFTILHISDVHGRDERGRHGPRGRAVARAELRQSLNEQVKIERGGPAIHLAGVDDAHFYRMDNIEKAAHGIPHDAFSILLSHTPEIYRQAAHADFNVLLSGHTHGGQMCLPGGIPVTLNCVLPRAMGNGSFKHHDMIGYTSAGAGVCIVPARFNCPPEITLHHLHRPS